MRVCVGRGGSETHTHITSAKTAEEGMPKDWNFYKSRELPRKKTGRINFIRTLKTNEKFIATRKTFNKEKTTCVLGRVL